jgi:hypothetical protein
MVDMRTLLFVLLFLKYINVYSQDTISISTSVHYISTEGYWESPSAHGQYRIIVFNNGWEHIASSLKVEWLSEVDSIQATTIDSFVWIKEINDGLFSLGQPQFIFNKKEISFKISGTNPYSMSKKTWLISLGLPGKYSILEIH